MLPGTPEQYRGIQKRLTPAVVDAMNAAFVMWDRGIATRNLMEFYRSSVEGMMLGVYGERAIGVFKWHQPPHAEVPERRYLNVLDNIGNAVGNEDFERAGEILKGLTSIYGSRGDSGGFPCDPEVLFQLAIVKSGLEPFLKHYAIKSSVHDKCQAIQSAISQVSQAFTKTHNRRDIILGLANFCDITYPYLMYDEKLSSSKEHKGRPRRGLVLAAQTIMRVLKRSVPPKS